MYTMTHMYFNYMFLPQTKAVTLGAMFPDTFIFSPLTHLQTHQNNIALVEFFKQKKPELLPFAKSVLLHEKLDYMGDKNWEGSGLGYCFIKGKEILDTVAEVFHTRDEAFALFKAHNFIEMAIQLLLVERYPHLTELFVEAVSDKKLIREIAEIVAEYFSLQPEAIERSFLRFPSIVEHNNPTPKNMVEKSNLQTLIKNKTTIDLNSGIALIEKAVEVIKWEYYPNTIDELCIFTQCKEWIKKEGIL